MKYKLTLALGLSAFLVGCGGGSSNSTTKETNSTTKETNSTSKTTKIEYKNGIIAAVGVTDEITQMLDGDEVSKFVINGDKAVMTGIIWKDTIRQVGKLAKEYPAVKTIVMQNVGGSIDDQSNLIASRLVRRAKLNTHVPKNGLIASGGTDFFIAGVKRTVEDGGKVGVHSWAGGEITDASTLPKDHESHKPYIKYYTEMGLPKPSEFYFFTIKKAKSDGMYYMSQEELKDFGLIN